MKIWKKIVIAKYLAESKIEHAVRELEKVMNVMTRKVIHLEEENLKVKVNRKNTQMNEPFEDTSDYKNSTPISKNKNLKACIEKSND